MKTFDIKKVAVIGTGTMGPGIAQVLAQHEIEVQIFDIDSEQLKKARETLGANLNLMEQAGMLSDTGAADARNRIQNATSLTDAVRDADLVIEVIPEVMDLKTRLLSELDEICGPDTILASNTSGLSITKMAQATRRPEKVVGMHWWNPPIIIPVIEIVKGESTGEDVLQTIDNLIRKIGKVPVLVKKDVPGFLGNRLQYALMREAIALLNEGVASAEDIDTMIKAGIGFKFPVMGPLETIDMAGLDIYYRVSQYLNKDLDKSDGAAPIVAKMVEQGDLGLKSGKGFYDYSNQDIKALMGGRIQKLLLLLKDMEYVK
ncbi:MAG: 3-hydroxyacyl-CoA dehydrogenase family protein [Deltaproteobacteria bacterium]|nr:MAG: 3-hydroxyacyl-CoA dehydrogenase family protein [Deltaproteobacteria bacterium]